MNFNIIIHDNHHPTTFEKWHQKIKDQVKDKYLQDKYPDCFKPLSTN